MLLAAIVAVTRAIDPPSECFDESGDLSACTVLPHEHVIELHADDEQLARQIAEEHGMVFRRKVDQ